MKISKLILSLCLTLIVGTTSVIAQNKKEREEKTAQQIKTIIESNHYKINVDRMLPMGGNIQTLASNYSLEVKKDSVISYLPYFGKAYSIPYGGGKGLIFEDAIVEYSAEYHPKGKVEVKFAVRTDEDRYTYRITIFSNASVSIHVNSNNRQPISYQGEMILPKK